MDKAEHSRGTGASAVVTAAFLLAVVATVGAALLLVPAPRSFLFWLATGFALFVEVVAYAFAGGPLALKLRLGQMSYPMIVATWVTLGLYALIGAGSILTYWFIRNGKHPDGRVIAAILLVETVVAILVVLRFRTWDPLFLTEQARVGAQREQHRANGASVQRLVERLRAVNCPDPACAVRIDRIAKRLESTQAGLLHSHGGGVGSREVGNPPTPDPVAERAVADVVGQLEVAIGNLNGGEDLAPRLDLIERLAASLHESAATLLLD